MQNFLVSPADPDIPHPAEKKTIKLEYDDAGNRISRHTDAPAAVMSKCDTTATAGTTKSI